MSKYETQEEIEKRLRFYRSEEVKKYLKKNGVPKSESAMRDLISVGYPDPAAETVESMGYVHFQVHPHQINISDRTNEKLIISIEK
ncbi:MAG: hypothetical protein ACYC7D_14375 [Nitrososphaerales archaeon]